MAFESYESKERFYSDGKDIQIPKENISKPISLYILWIRDVRV